LMVDKGVGYKNQSNEFGHTLFFCLNPTIEIVYT
jgi:hypothetical protein